MRLAFWLRGLKIRFAVGVGLLLVVVGTPFFYLFYTLHRDRSIESLEQSTADMSRVLVQTIEHSMFEQSPHTLARAVSELADSELVQRVLIVDKSGQVVVSTDPRAVGQRVLRDSPTCRVCHARAPASRAPATIITDAGGTEVFRTMRPVYNRPACHACHSPSDVVNGILMLDYSTAAMRARFRADIWRMFDLAIVMLPVTLAAIALLMNRLVVRRVQSLVRATRQVRGGDLSVKASTAGHDELAVLGESFNAMTVALRDSIRQIDHQRSYLEHVIDSIEEQVFVLDRSLHIVTANRSFVTATGLWKGAIIGQPCDAVAHGGSHVQCETCPAQAVFATGRVQKTHVVVPDPDGRDRQYEVFCSPLLDERGVVAQAIEVRRDITERASLEANLHHSERLAALGLLASGVSHEINNPLASIAACAEGLIRQVENDRAAAARSRETMLEYLRLIGRETRRAKAITDRLLILSRPSTGLVGVVDVNRAVQDTVSLLKFQAENAGVALATELQANLPRLVADEAQVGQLVLNLVLNAIQAASAAPRRPGCVSVKTCARDGKLELAVVDNGPGIAPGESKKIFEPFYTRRAAGRGTGLGLFIVQAIVRGLRGEIRVSSWPGEGAAFVVEVPLHEAQGANPDRR